VKGGTLQGDGIAINGTVTVTGAVDASLAEPIAIAFVEPQYIRYNPSATHQVKDEEYAVTRQQDDPFKCILTPPIAPGPLKKLIFVLCTCQGFAKTSDSEPAFNAGDISQRGNMIFPTYEGDSISAGVNESLPQAVDNQTVMWWLSKVAPLSFTQPEFVAFWLRHLRIGTSTANTSSFYIREYLNKLWLLNAYHYWRNAGYGGGMAVSEHAVPVQHVVSTEVGTGRYLRSWQLSTNRGWLPSISYTQTRTFRIPIAFASRYQDTPIDYDEEWNNGIYGPFLPYSSMFMCAIRDSDALDNYINA